MPEELCYIIVGNIKGELCTTNNLLDWVAQEKLWVIDLLKDNTQVYLSESQPYRLQTWFYLVVCSCT